MTTALVASVGKYALNKLFDAFRGDEGPEVAPYEARGEVRSEVTPRRWIVGTARVAGVLARHADMIYARVAQDYWDSNADEDDNDRLLGATERMRVYGYFAHALAEGETDGVRAVWVDGVRMPVAGIDEPRTYSDRVQNGDFGPPAEGRTYDPFYVDQYETRRRDPPRLQPHRRQGSSGHIQGLPLLPASVPGLLAEQGRSHVFAPGPGQVEGSLRLRPGDGRRASGREHGPRRGLDLGTGSLGPEQRGRPRSPLASDSPA